jgi:cyclopropane fatty-acyl-phospholipid synthase-like methyltransferase
MPVFKDVISGGRFLNSGIVATATDHRQGPSFIDHYVFPDGELVPLNTSLGEAERSGFEVRDVESLREHYALTLHHWVRRLESPTKQHIASGRLYMATGEALHGQGGMLITRADWYRD